MQRVRQLDIPAVMVFWLDVEPREHYFRMRAVR